MNKLEYIPGDLVMVDNDIVKVMTRGVNYFLKIINNYDVMFHSGNVYKYSPNELKPIPLTPEILEKNGWRTQNRWYYYLDVAEGFISYIGIDFKHKSNKGYLYVEVDGNNMVEIQYCHELQHFLFGLGLNSEMEV